MESNHIQHHGIKGMKWGIRRYQNKDGSLTTAGKKRKLVNYAAEAKGMSDQELRAQINRMNLEKRYTTMSKSTSSKASKFLDTTGKVASIGNNTGKMANDGFKLKDQNNPNAKLAGQGLNLVSKSVNAAKRINNIAEDRANVKRTKSKLANMSDKELQDIVNRMDLERQYSSLKEETVSRGKITVDNVLDVASDIMAIGASATAIAVSIHNLKKGK